MTCCTQNPSPRSQEFLASPTIQIEENYFMISKIFIEPFGIEMLNRISQIGNFGLRVYVQGNVYFLGHSILEVTNFFL